MPENEYRPLDDLSDVVLESRDLVSDDPSDWLLCRSLADTTDLFEWWENLTKLDDKAHQTFSPVVLQQLRSLQAAFQMAYESDRTSAKGRREIRQILVDILSLGLTTEQAAMLCGSTRHRITQLLVSQHVLSPQQVQVRMKAETLLREGHGPSQVVLLSGMTPAEVQGWTKTLSIKSPRRNKSGQAKPKALRDRAMELYDQGMRGVSIVRTLQREMPEWAEGLDDALVGQWARRSGRTNRQQVA